ncbi:MAG: hypothetical protein DRI23_03880 [Candidatus Cloacimonadota bacterium]|nr:MAG: hypothetical protein DRI23_03880 [Candidatus Cloacimonadota bacterium]
MKLRNVFVVYLIFGIALFAYANEDLKKEMIDVSGWEAGEIEDASVNMAGLKFTSVNRFYEKDDMEFSVSFIAGSNTMLQGYQMDVTIETDEVSIESFELNGFRIVKSYDKMEKTGAYMIDLASSDMSGSMLLMSFTNIDTDSALEILQEFNWEKLRKIAKETL